MTSQLCSDKPVCLTSGEKSTAAVARKRAVRGRDYTKS